MAKFARIYLPRTRCIRAKRRAGAALSSGPLTASPWCFSAWVVYGLDALPLVLEAELLPAALLAFLFALWLLGRRRRFPYTTALVADDDGRAESGDEGTLAPGGRHQAGAAAPSSPPDQKSAQTPSFWQSALAPPPPPP